MTITSLGERTHIDILAIERELTALWKQATEPGEGGEQATVTRTCVLNLVIITRGGLAAQQATETVARLTARHPNRAIVVGAAPEAQEDAMDAWVQAHCQMPGPGRPQVCCEQITIEARGAALARVPGTVLPLLVPDVPVMLWYPRGEPFDDPSFVRLSALADRIIVDSATFAAPEAGQARLAGLLDSDTAISDLNWSRLTPWRELAAQFFDAPAMLPHLSEIERVAVEYEARAGEATDRSQALLLAGWLASRLGWRVAAVPEQYDTRTTLRLARGGDTIQIELRPAEPKQDALDRVAALAIECRRARFAITRGDGPDGAVARAEVEGMQPLERKVRLERLDEAELIAEELRLLGRDRTFESALRAAAGFVGD